MAETSNCSRQAIFVSPRGHPLRATGVKGEGGGPGKATIVRGLLVLPCNGAIHLCATIPPVWVPVVTCLT